jgi:hypothetical protein
MKGIEQHSTEQNRSADPLPNFGAKPQTLKVSLMLVWTSTVCQPLQLYGLVAPSPTARDAHCKGGEAKSRTS